MKSTISLQKHLVYGLTLGITLLWLVAAGLSGLAVQHELNETFDNAMQETAQRILPLAVLDILNREDPVAPQRVASLSAQQGGYSYVVRDGQGNTQLQSLGADPAVFDPGPIQGFRTTATHRLFGASALSDTIFMQIAEPLAHRREAAWESGIALLLPVLLLIPVTLLGVWLFVRFSLRSMRHYRQAIEARGAGDLSSIRVDKLPTEMSPVADAVNRLLERLTHALEAERRFTANSAHELRTPLATALAQAQRLRREAPDGPLRVRAVHIEASLKELARLSEKLLQLAKAEGGGLLSETPQDLVALLGHVVEEQRRDRDVVINVTSPPAGTVLSSIDPDAFAILVRNLIENAAKHGSEGTTIEVSLSSTACLRVANAGAVVPAEDLARLSQRFVRGGTPAPGFGLGLAIVSTIAAGVGATLTLASPSAGRSDGFEASVQFVMAAPS
ncbi:MAG TPA: HAMP domain-containing sensor histidine kinase [Burkholderiaceae bacterium]|nr:HAMP domain-containing sensor histidine kinase [Burkholderiaceae bacterium]